MDNLLSALRAAGEETRLRILGLLVHGELTVSEITQILSQSQPRVSRHLKLLCEAGLLLRFQEGTWAFYRLAEDGEVGALTQTIAERIPADNIQHKRDLERLEDIRANRAVLAASYFSKNAENWSQIRKLYVPEQQVEDKLLAAVKGKAIHNLLDVGTGTGRILEIFAPHIEKGLGIDLSQDMLAVARTNFAEHGLKHCQARQGDMYNIPAEGSSQDVVIIHQVLHYADQPEEVLREAARVLRPDGTLLLVDFAPHELEELRDQHAHRRLGFSDSEMLAWGKAANLNHKKTTRLAGEKLTVKIWHFNKPLAHVRLSSISGGTNG
ncbi:MAG: ArsR family transcriptional regulator [Sphingomonadales bacterium]|nr:ArsR family transcriptional regulator [Sphingomonadales bacterium]